MGITELLVIFAIILVLFGSRKLPELADGMGKAIRNFKRGLDHEDEGAQPAEKQVSERSSASELGSSSQRATTERKS